MLISPSGDRPVVAHCRVILTPSLAQVMVVVCA